MHELSQQLSNIERAMGRLEGKVGRLEGKVDGIVGIFAERGLRLDRLEDDADALTKDVSGLKKKMNYATGFVGAVGLGAGYFAKHALAAFTILALLAEPAHALL